MKTWLLAAALVLANGASIAATYTFTGRLYDVTGDFLGPCAIPSCANFTTAMRVQGQFSTAADLPANLASADISALLTGYSFSDGLTAYSNADAQLRLYEMSVSTDAAGNITAFEANMQRWRAPGGAHAAGDRLDSIYIGPGGESVRYNAPCGAVGVSPHNATADLCTGAGFDANTSQAVTLTPTLPALVPVVAAASIPTLGEWTLALLALTLAAAAWSTRRE